MKTNFIFAAIALCIAILNSVNAVPNPFCKEYLSERNNCNKESKRENLRKRNEDEGTPTKGGDYPFGHTTIITETTTVTKFKTETKFSTTSTTTTKSIGITLPPETSTKSITETTITTK